MPFLGRSKLWSLRSCNGSGRRPVIGQGRCARWCNDLASRIWFDDGYMFCIIQGGSWKIFCHFLRGWVDSAFEVDSPSWPARRRQWQSHVPYWFCWFDAPRALFPRLPAVCRSMLQLLASCTWKSVHYFLRASCIFSIFHVRNLRELIFWSPRALTGVSVRGLGIGADAGSSLAGVGPPVVHN